MLGATMVCMGGMLREGMEVIVVMLIMLVGIVVSCGDKSSSAEPNSFSSFSKSSSWVDRGC